MKVYDTMTRNTAGLHTLFVAPAAEDATARVAEWQDKDGNPKTISVQFKGGAAEVPDNLGRFLVEHGHALKSRPLIYAR